ncbi:MAG: hypothetical protein ACRDKJ_01190 [Actinomycetota bacterium]
MIALPDLAPARPPCSAAERAAAEALASTFGRLGLQTSTDVLRGATSPTWVPLLRALLRVWAVAFVAAYRPVPAIVLASLAVAGGIPQIGALIRFIPLIGATTQNVVAKIPGTDAEARPIVVTAHIDTHPTSGAVIGRLRTTVGAVLGCAALAAAISARPGLPVWRATTAIVAVEAIAMLVWLARRELARTTGAPDDNTSGVFALLSVAQLGTDQRPVHDVWLVATGAGTSGGHGLTAFLRRHPQARQGWVVEIDALGAGEVIAAPFAANFPRPGTPPPLVRAIVTAARMSGDPLNVRQVRRAHSDARAALRMRTAAIALTGGLHPPSEQSVPDAGNVERAARIVDRLARSDGPA